MYNLTTQLHPTRIPHARQHEAALLAALSAPATWQSRGRLAWTLRLTEARLDSTLARLLRQRHIQRRGERFRYEYALSLEEA